MYIVLLKLCPFVLFAVAQTGTQEPKTKYVVVDEETTFLEALRRCTRRGMDPAEIITQEDQKEFVAVINNGTDMSHYWIFVATVTTYGTELNYYWWLNSRRPLLTIPNVKIQSQYLHRCFKVDKRKSWLWESSTCESNAAFVCQIRPSPSWDTMTNDWKDWFQKELQSKDEQWLNKSSEANAKNSQTINELNATLEATKRKNEELKEKVLSERLSKESFQKQLQLKDEQWLKQLQIKDEQCLNKSIQWIHEANSKNLQKINELDPTLQATKRRIEKLEEKVNSVLKLPNEEWFQKQLQLRDEQWLNKSNQLIREATSKNLEKINELAATTEELKEKVRRQCPTGGDIGDIQI